MAYPRSRPGGLASALRLSQNIWTSIDIYGARRSEGLERHDGMVPIIAILGAQVALGAANLAYRLRGQRKGNLIGAHFMLGIGAVAVVVFFLKDINGGEGIPAGSYGNVAAGLLALALFIGLINPVWARDNPVLSNALLVAHVASAVGGVVAAALWISSV
jgi:hypothetical protein